MKNIRKPVKKRRTGGKRRKKPGSSDAIRAVLLTAALIVAAAFISLVVIVVRSGLKTEDRRRLGPDRFPPLAVEVLEEPERQPRPEDPPAGDPRRVPAAPAVSTAPAAPAAPATPATPAASAMPAAPEKTRPANQAPPAPRTRVSPPAASPEHSSPSAGRAAEGPSKEGPATAPARTTPAARPGPPVEEAPGPRHRGTLAFVIDDAGNNLRELEPFLRFPGPLTIAVLPGLPNSAEAARRIRAAGKEVFLHQPMEAIGGQNPGPGAIYAEMSAPEIRAVLEQNVAELGPIAGINNHQGSKVTMNGAAMETVLAFCREQGLYFLDSRTTAETAAPAAAKRLGIKIGERDVFIDNIQEKSSMIRYIDDGLVRAQQRGRALMIGHTWSPELAPVLSELYPGFLEKGYSLSTASRLIGDSAN